MFNNMMTNQDIMGKEGISVTIEKKVLDELNSYCTEKCINRSKLIESLVITFLKENGKNNKK